MNIYRRIIDHHKNYNIIHVNKWNDYELYKQEKNNNNYNTTKSISKTSEQLWTNTTNTILSIIYIYDLMPKGVQEKRREVLENKVDRMWVSNAFFEWTHVKSSTSEGRRQCCSSFLRNLTFSVICDKMLNITHYNKPTSLSCWSYS